MRNPPPGGIIQANNKFPPNPVPAAPRELSNVSQSRDQLQYCNKGMSNHGS